MNIIFLGGNFDRAGGTERVATVIANGFSRRGHDVLLTSVQGSNCPFFCVDYKINKKTLCAFAGRNLYRAPFIIARLRKLLIEEQPDVLVVAGSMLSVFSIPATLGLKLRHVCWEHHNFDVDLGKFGRRVARRLAARYCHTVVTLTERDKKLWLAGTSSRADLVTIPNPSPFKVQEQRAPSTDGRLVLSVGRLVAQKGYDLLLRAWKKVAVVEPGWRLRIVGDGQEKEALVNLCKDLRIDDTVDFFSSTSDVARHYREASIYCLSSRFEGFGLVLLEAASFGLPTVSFNCDFGPAEILDGTGSLLVCPGDIGGLSEAILRLVKNPSHRERIGKAMRERAELFQPDSIMDRWVYLVE